MASSSDGRRGDLSLAQLFLVFLKAGLAFGGGVAITAVLEEELVTRRRLVSREEFLALYGIGRIAPCGTVTALAVAYGHRYQGQLGIVAALTAMVLPGFLSTVALTALYKALVHGPALDWLGVTVLPATLALILVSAIRLGRDVFRPSVDLALAGAALVAALVFKQNPALILLGGGIVGAFALGRIGARR